MAVVLMAKFTGDVAQFTRAYDEAHRTIMERGVLRDLAWQFHDCCDTASVTLGNRSGRLLLTRNARFPQFVGRGVTG